MAEIGAIGNLLTTPAPGYTPAKGNNAPVDNKPSASEVLSEQNKVQDEKRVEKREEELKDVVATSKDGDTIQVSEPGREKLNDEQLGKVYLVSGDEEAAKVAEAETDKKENIDLNEADKAAREARAEAERKARENAEEAADAREKIADSIKEQIADVVKVNLEPKQEKTDDSEEVKADITSFNGYSDSQLEQMYLKGDISMLDYNNEISKREEQRAAEKEQANEFSSDMNKDIAKAGQIERGNEAIEAAFDENANDTLNAEDRIGFVKAAEDFATQFAQQ